MNWLLAHSTRIGLALERLERYLNRSLIESHLIMTLLPWVIAKVDFFSIEFCSDWRPERPPGRC